MFEIFKNIFFKEKRIDKNLETNIKYLEYIITQFINSQKRYEMLTGERYYRGIHDILFRKREIIGEGGRLQEVENLPNNKRIDNQYEKLVDQKINYLLGKPITFYTENKEYQKYLSQIFNSNFFRIIKILGEDSINNGIAWLYPHYDNNGDFLFRVFEPTEILPIWRDEAHTILEFVIRIFIVQEWTGNSLEDVEKVEVYGLNGIEKYGYKYGSLKYEGHEDYFTSDENGYNWEKIPFIPFKFNNLEKPLIKKVKTLQDGLNKIISTFENNLDEDPRRTILILKNYDGQNLGEFRKNLSQYGAVKVKGDGGVESLAIEINHENYTAMLKIFKDAIIENGRGFNAKDDRLGNNPNEMNIQSMYADIDLDAVGMETEFKVGLEKLLYFINIHLFNTRVGDFEKEKVDIIFNKDILVNEAQSIENCTKSIGILSDETIISQHPWVKDVKAEMARIKSQKEMLDYNGAFKGPGDPDVEE
ncbi:phage portal protein [Fusobacterium sp.]|uniref:phage portal protein n=1 Tax=Fusobacterium sp. TaxID=68766 RepID=UPI0026390A12|nr:phage portal protein [Fusobacterium sp.]